MSTGGATTSAGAAGAALAGGGTPAEPDVLPAEGVNPDVDAVPARIAALADKYKDAHTYTIDGFSAEYPDWHFNVRASNTEPLLRLNLEALTPELMLQRRDEVLAIIR